MLKLLTQRGQNGFLIKNKGKYFMTDTSTKKKFEVDSPDEIYKGGYCEEPNPTQEQRAILEKMFE